jgi:mRNA interferase MazF
MMRPKRGEIWLVEFEPQRGAEIQKTRPAVVLSIKEIEKIPIRIVVPIREFKAHHEQIIFFIALQPTRENGLSKLSSVDCTQVKSFALERFIKRLGAVSESELREITEAVGLCIGL